VYNGEAISDIICLTVILQLNIKEGFTMPTNKTPFTFHIEDEYLEKMRYIAKRETRSLSNLLEHVCKLYIEKYEQEQGEIETKNISE